MEPLSGDELIARERRFEVAMRVLPGSSPYTNVRPMNIGGAYEGLTVAEFLARQHPHREARHWEVAQDEGRLSIDGKLLRSLEQVVRGGNRLEHRIPDTVEPWVDHGVRFLYQDPSMLVVGKPAPLPIHPCGRFNRNSLVPMLRLAFPQLDAKPVHRLDVDTTGVVVLGLNRESARALAQQFEARRVDKRYLALVRGRPPWSRDLVELGVSAGPRDDGRRAAAPLGKSARIRLQVLRHHEDATLLEVEPHTGRTNQIRLHLASIGFPIVGDSAYGEGERSTKTSARAMSAVSSLCLHAWRLSLKHPSTGQPMRFESPAPTWAGDASRFG